MRKWFLVALIVACNACGDLLNTAGMRRHGEVNDLRPTGIARLLRRLVRNGYVLGGIFFMAVAFFALLSLLSIAEVSFAVPATASSFLIETILAKLILREDVHWQRWLGASLVVCGVALLALA
jgi:drug/metabolite transporter (DMT)-like permease